MPTSFLSIIATYDQATDRMCTHIKKPLKLYLVTNSDAVGALIDQEDQKGAD